MRLIKYCSLLFALLLYGCSDAEKDSSISEKIRAQFQSHASEIDLLKAGPEGWQHVCLFAPHSDNQTAKALLGFDWDLESKSQIRSNESISLLVFLKDQQVLAYAEHPRSEGDFTKITKSGCLERSQARFQREQLQ